MDCQSILPCRSNFGTFCSKTVFYVDKSSGLHSIVGFDHCYTFGSDDIRCRSVEGQVLSIDMYEVPLDLVWKGVLIKIKQKKME